MAKIKAGTYQLNDTLLVWSMGGLYLPFTLTATAKEYGVSVFATCSRIGVYDEGVMFRVESTNPDMSAVGITLPGNFPMYDTSGDYAFNGWNTVDFDEGIKTITVLEDTEVDDNHALWFRLNTKHTIHVTYGGYPIAALNDGESVTLNCAGMKMGGDIVVSAKMFPVEDYLHNE